MTEQLISFGLMLTFFLTFGFFLAVLAIISPSGYGN